MTTFNVDDYRVQIDKALIILKTSDTKAYGAVNFLTYIARQEFLYAGQLSTANRLTDMAARMRNKSILQRLQTNFPVFCGFFGIRRLKDSTMRIAYLPEPAMKLNRKTMTWTCNADDATRQELSEHIESQLGAKTLFWNLNPIQPESLESVEIEAKRYKKIITGLFALRDSYKTWKDSDYAMQFSKLLDAVKSAIPEIESDYISNLIQSLTEEQEQTVHEAKIRRREADAAAQAAAEKGAKDKAQAAQEAAAAAAAEKAAKEAARVDKIQNQYIGALMVAVGNNNPTQAVEAQKLLEGLTDEQKREAWNRVPSEVISIINGWATK